MVLLKVDWIKAFPMGTDLRSRRFALGRFFCAILILLDYLFLSHAAPLSSSSHCLALTAPGAGIGPGSLSSGRQVMTVPATAVAPDFNEAFDIEVNLFAEVALDRVLPVNNFPEADHFFLSEVAYLGLRADISLSYNLLAQGTADTINILK